MDGTDAGEPVYVAELPGPAPGSGPSTPEPPPRRSHRWWWIGAAAVVVAAGGVTAGVLLNGSDDARGELTANLAAQHFVAALNAGDKAGAAAASCANFADEARSAAESGADPGIDFTLASVHVGSDSGSASLVQHITFPDTTQAQTHVVRLERTGGRWLVCGQE